MIQLGLEDILEWGDVIRYLDGREYLIVHGLAGRPVSDFVPEYEVFRKGKPIPKPKVKLCDECYTRHKPGENDLCSC